MLLQKFLIKHQVDTVNREIADSIDNIRLNASIASIFWKTTMLCLPKIFVAQNRKTKYMEEINRLYMPSTLINDSI